MTTIIKITIAGEELEFEILGKGDTLTGNLWEKATHVIGVDGDIRKLGSGSYLAYLRLIRKRHTFGSINLEETGEKSDRFKWGEWYLGSDGRPAPVSSLTRLTGDYPILRPVVLEVKE